MIRFAHPEYLYLLVLLPAMVAAFLLFSRMRSNASRRFSTSTLFQRLAERASGSRRLWKFVLLAGATGLLIVALANPQIGTRLEDVKQEGVDIYIALDVSLSMKAEDIKPNRLEKAKLELRNLISRLAGDRVGLVIFAGEAFTQFPLTTDYSAANLFIDVVDVNDVPVPGTAIGDAINRAVESFDYKDPTTKVIVIMTDGENTEGDAIEAAQDAAKKGILLYTIGLGSPTGAPIPVYNGSGQQVDFKRDKSGNVVVSKLDEEGLQRIADIGNGKYFRGTNSQDELDEIYKNINSLQKREFGVKQFTDYESRYQWFLFPAIVFLLAEVFISEKAALWLQRWNPLRREEEAA
ncbi:MAG: VWA domain-containing protein [Bacteroidota bacterium]